MPKKIYLLLIVTVLNFKVNAQTRSSSANLPLQRATEQLQRSFEYASSNTKAPLASLIMRRNGCGIADALLYLETVGVNINSRNIVFRALYEFTQGDKDYLFLNLHNLGLPAVGAQVITDHILGTYAQQERKVALNNEKQAKINASVDYNNAKVQYQKLIDSCIKGLVTVREDQLDLSSKIENIELLKTGSKLIITHDNFAVNYKKDSLKFFLPKFFKDELLYFTVSKNGRLLSVGNNHGKELLVKNYPFLKDWISVNGNFNLMIENKAYPINYCYRALRVSQEECPLIKQYYFALGNKEFDFVTENSIPIGTVTMNSAADNCPIQVFYQFNKDEIQRSVFTTTNVNDIKELKKLSNTNSKVGSKLLNTGFLIATHMPMSTASIHQNDNLFRFTGHTDRTITQITDVSKFGDLKILLVDDKATTYNLEVYNPVLKNFEVVKMK